MTAALLVVMSRATKVKLATRGGRESAEWPMGNSGIRRSPAKFLTRALQMCLAMQSEGPVPCGHAPLGQSTARAEVISKASEGLEPIDFGQNDVLFVGSGMSQMSQFEALQKCPELQTRNISSKCSSENLETFVHAPSDFFEQPCKP